MKEKNESTKKTTTQSGKGPTNLKDYRKDAPGAISGINTPGVDLPAFNPPVPNRAWTAMQKGIDIDSLSEEEKRELYLGRDDIF